MVLLVVLFINACADALYLDRLYKVTARYCMNREYRTLTFDKPIARSDLFKLAKHELPSVLHLKSEDMNFTELRIVNIHNTKPVIREMNVYIYTFDSNKLKSIYFTDVRASLKRTVIIEVI